MGGIRLTGGWGRGVGGIRLTGGLGEGIHIYIDTYNCLNMFFTTCNCVCRIQYYICHKYFSHMENIIIKNYIHVLHNSKT